MQTKRWLKNEYGVALRAAVEEEMEVLKAKAAAEEAAAAVAAAAVPRTEEEVSAANARTATSEPFEGR